MLVERMKSFVEDAMKYARAREDKEVIVDLSQFPVTEEELEMRGFFELDKEFKEEATLILLPKKKLRIVFNLK